jgi:hypothetical protein
MDDLGVPPFRKHRIMFDLFFSWWCKHETKIKNEHQPMNHRDLKYGVTEFDLTQVQAVDHTTNRQWFITSVHNHLENLGIGDLLTRIFSHLL